MTVLETVIIYEHNYGVGLVDCFKKFLREDEWQNLVVWNLCGAIAAVSYCIAQPQQKVSKRVFASLLPDESALTDVEFWQRH